MKRRYPCRRSLALLCLGLALGFEATAGATTYTHPTTGQPPTDVDLVMIEGSAKTLAVRILNLSPYLIEFNESASTECGVVESDRHTYNPCMYAPLGWPSKLPELAGKWEQEEDLTYIFMPTSPNHEVHPYNFVLTFNDSGNYQETGTMGWTIRNVWNPIHGGQKDVELRLWITRNKPTERLRSEVFRVIRSAFVEVADLVGVALDPANPIAWMDLFIATKELASSSFEAANTEETGGEKMYAAAYVVPELVNSNTTPMYTTYSTSGEPTDAVDVQWGTVAGNYCSNLYVTSHLLRGDDVNYKGCCGSAPILAITIWEPEMYKWSMAVSKTSALKKDRAGNRINSTLQRNTKEGYKLFASIHNSLDAEQRENYRAAFQALVEKKHLTKEQSELLEQIAEALEKKRTSLQGEEASHERKRHARPSHERPNGGAHNG
ncbi:MAG TPA: hypothetical protein VLT81_08555 [Chondromyces sp.]|nr:hypothetical protein [Chondromyces sp.]